MRVSRITLVCSTLHAGGAERTVANMANFWVARGHEVCVLTFTPPAQDFYTLSNAIDRRYVKLIWDSKSLLQRVVDQIVRIAKLRRSILDTQPEVVLSFVDVTNVRVLLSLIGTRVPVVASERSNPERWPVRAIWKLLRHFAYRRANTIVTQTKQVEGWVARLVSDSRVVTIPNAAVKQTAVTLHSVHRERHIIAIGRLSPEKGFDNLLRVWRELMRDFPSWRLVILGDGDDRRRLEKFMQKYHMAGNVLLPGKVSDPERWLLRSSVFVLSSRFEGFPNALLEAMAVGVVPVAFDCEYGPAEIIRDGVDGVLVEDQNLQSLQAGLRVVLENENLRNRLASRAPEVLDRFSQSKVMDQWERTIEPLLKPGSRSS